MKSYLKNILKIILLLPIFTLLPNTNCYAEENPWVNYKSINLTNTKDIEYGKEFFDWRNSGMYHNQTSASYIKFYFYGTKIRILDDRCSNRKSGSKIYIDNYPAEGLSSYGSYQSMATLYSKTGLNKKLHSVYIDIPYEYNQYFSMFIIDVDKDGYICKTPNYNDDKISVTLQGNSNIKTGDNFSLDLAERNIKGAATSDIYIKYDSSKVKLNSVSNFNNIRPIKIKKVSDGVEKISFVNLGDENITTTINPLKLNFTAIKAGMNVVDVSKVTINNKVKNKLYTLPDYQCGRIFLNINN